MAFSTFQEKLGFRLALPPPSPGEPGRRLEAGGGDGREGSSQPEREGAWLFLPAAEQGTLPGIPPLLQSSLASGTSSYVSPGKLEGKGLEARLPRSLPHPVSSRKHDSTWG